MSDPASDPRVEQLAVDLAAAYACTIDEARVVICRALRTDHPDHPTHAVRQTPERTR